MKNNMVSVAAGKKSIKVNNALGKSCTKASDTRFYDYPKKKRWNTKFSTINFVVVCHDDIALWAFSINHPHIFEFPTAFGSNKQYAS